MKKYIIISIIAIASGSLFGQQALTKQFMPKAGDTLFYKSTMFSSLDFSPTGADFIWDYSTIGTTTWVADTFVSVLSTPLTYNAVFNNIFVPKYKATVASPQADMTIPPSTTITNVYNYYKETDTAYAQVGLAANVAGAPVPVRFDDIDYIYKFPSNMGDVDSCYSSYVIDIPTLGTYSKKLHRVNEYDGWGTLYTPNDTFTVFRIKTILNSRDSVYITQYNVPIAFNRTTTEYKWFAAGHRTPVFFASVAQTGTTVKYVDKPNLYTAIQDNKTAKFTILPNPFENSITIQTQGDSKADLIRIFSITGAEIPVKISSKEGQTYTISTEQLAKGSYIIEIRNAQSVERKTVIKN
jgi:hypothetical protein